MSERITIDQAIKAFEDKTVFYCIPPKYIKKIKREFAKLKQELSAVKERLDKREDELSTQKTLTMGMADYIDDRDKLVIKLHNELQTPKSSGEKERKLIKICKDKSYCLNIHYCRTGDVMIRIDKPDENGFIDEKSEQYIIHKEWHKFKSKAIDSALRKLEDK